jgi:periplasmic divalent cation tolerance protein
MADQASKARIVFITTPRDEANKLARTLVEMRLAACVNLTPRIESYFWWDDAVQHDEEALLIVKTTEAKLDDLMTYVAENHSYDLPEVIALPLSEGLPEYLAWIEKETQG